MGEDANGSPKDPLYELVGTALSEVRELRKETQEVSRRVDKAHLNGDTPALREMAAFWRTHGEEMVLIAESAHAVVAMVKAEDDRKTMWRQIKRTIRWDQGTGFVVRAFIIGAAAASAWLAIVSAHTAPAPTVQPMPTPSISTPSPSAHR